MEKLLIILSLTSGVCAIIMTFIIGKNIGSSQLKKSLNKMTVREILARKRDKFNSL